ncbi:MAG: endopeptidase [Acidobacteria bacterium]|nr:MAG: endopeptidase [Acidobacteriota bacterium]
MPTAKQLLTRIAIATYLVLLHIAVIYLVGERIAQRYTSIEPIEKSSISDPTEKKSIPTPLPVPEEFADPEEANSNSNIAVPSPSPLGPSTSGLIIPVVGVKADKLVDTFTSSRSEGRVHDAIDIMAPGGTPVVAATDGEIVKFFDSERGGITIYQLTPDKKFVLYYAHLQRRADGIAEGMQIKQGTTIGFVGDTGNAGPGNTHLHFSIAAITDPKHFWTGTYLNPYSILKSGGYPQ